MPDELPTAPEHAWTGRQLLVWLQQNPRWLDRPVRLMCTAEEDDEAA
jgi:hypothetical protein